MQFARVNDVVLHYASSGVANHPALVFVNSLGTDFRIWDTVSELLGKDFHILRYDKRGHGLSQETPAPYAMKDHVNDLVGLLDHLGIRRAHICGLSVGGMIAQWLAAERPALVDRLILMGTASKIGDEDSWNSRIENVRSHGISAMVDGIMEKWFTAAFRNPTNPLFIGCKAMLQRSPAEGYIGTCAALRDCDLTASTRKLALPVLALAGAEDGSTPPALVKAMADLIAHSRFETIAGAAHIACVEAPETTARLIADFLHDKRLN